MIILFNEDKELEDSGDFYDLKKNEGTTEDGLVDSINASDEDLLENETTYSEQDTASKGIHGDNIDKISIEGHNQESIEGSSTKSVTLANSMSSNNTLENPGDPVFNYELIGHHIEEYLLHQNDTITAILASSKYIVND